MCAFNLRDYSYILLLNVSFFISRRKRWRRRRRRRRRRREQQQSQSREFRAGLVREELTLYQ